MQEVIRELRGEVYASKPELLTQIRETVVAGDVAAVRIDGPEGPPPKHDYIAVLLKRTDAGWRVAGMDDAGDPPALVLAKWLERRAKGLPRFRGEKECLKLVFATLWRASQRWRGVRFTTLEREELNRYIQARRADGFEVRNLAAAA